MKITKKGEYALHALLTLASEYGGKAISLRQIAKQEKIPYKFLEQIMSYLKQSGFVESTQGKQGGYVLARSPKKIKLGEIIRAVEGPLSPIATAEEIKKRILREEHHPGLYVALLEVRDAISKILDHKTLQDVCDKSVELTGSKSSANQMYYI